MECCVDQVGGVVDEVFVCHCEVGWVLRCGLCGCLFMVRKLGMCGW